MEVISQNIDKILYIALVLYAIAKLVVNLTPSEKDNDILVKVASFISKVVDAFVPNLKKGGGTVNMNLFNEIGKIKIKKK